jgi:hypothetical protein
VNLSKAPSTPCITTCRKRIATFGQSEPWRDNPTPDYVERSCAVEILLCYELCHTHRLPLSYVLPHIPWLGGTEVNSRHHGASGTAAAATAAADTGAWAASGWLPYP